MRDFMLLFINGSRREVRGADAFMTLSSFLRQRLKLCGTKIVCSEGDCGSCSVLCGRRDGNRFDYRAIDSCIRFVFQLDGCHVVTVEGLGSEEHPSPVQQAMIDCHGSQCGFCTPGFVAAMTGILEYQKRPSTEAWRHGLTGNLCRCTGYVPIVQAGLQSARADHEPLGVRFSDESLLAVADEIGNEPIMVTAELSDQSQQTVFCPTTVEQAVEFLDDNPDARIVAGATDIGVQFNKGRCSDRLWLDLNRIESLRAASIKDGCLVAGAGTTWAELESLTTTTIPEFHEIIKIFGSPQIRNAGTIGGNLINASPISDSLPLLHVCDARLNLVSSAGHRTVNVNGFYSGYKQMDLKPCELLAGIEIPLPTSDQHLKLYKTSRRLDMDISTFTAAMLFEFETNAAASGVPTIKAVRVAFGAVGPIVLRLKKTEQMLVGRPFSESSMKEAGEMAVTEITPISDVRGQQSYRLQLARNIFLKFFHEVEPEGVVA